MLVVSNSSMRIDGDMAADWSSEDTGVFVNVWGPANARRTSICMMLYYVISSA